MTIEIKNVKFSIGELRVTKGELVAVLNNLSYSVEAIKVEGLDISKLGWTAEPPVDYFDSERPDGGPEWTE